MKRLFLLLILAVASAVTSTAGPSIRYTLGMPKPWTHLFEVEVAVEGLPRGIDTLELALPVWRTGRYAIFDFAGGVQRVTASDESNRPLAIEKRDKSSWAVALRGARGVKVRYLVYANEFNMRTRGLNDEHGFVDGTAVFMYAPAYREAPVSLTVLPYGDWHVTTGLDSVRGKRFEFTAQGYDYLADCPIEIGTQSDYVFTVEGKPHVLSISGPTNLQPDSLIALVSRIVRMNAAFWGGLPYDRYVFIVHAMPDAGGGTEHLNSCVLDIAPSFSRRPDNGRGLVGLFSHEFLHTWNVKRLRPKGMDPYDWSRENYYRELWLAEGGTSYLHGLLLMRNGFSSAAGYVDGIHWQVENDRLRPGNTEQSLSACSFDAWIKFSRNLPEAYDFETDIYGKGAQVCMLLDLEMRWRTSNKSSFDDLMRTLYRRFPLGGGGYTVDDVERTATELAGAEMKQFFLKFVHGTAPLEWERILGYAGLALIPGDTSARPWLGVMAMDDGGRTVIRRVVAGSTAYEAGLNVGDELLALNGIRVRAADLPRWLEEMNVGETATLTVFRQDRLRELRITLGRQPVPAYAVRKVAAPTGLQKKIYESWLQQPWDAR